MLVFSSPGLTRILKFGLKANEIMKSFKEKSVEIDIKPVAKQKKGLIIFKQTHVRKPTTHILIQLQH